MVSVLAEGELRLQGENDVRQEWLCNAKRNGEQGKTERKRLRR